MDFDSLPKNDAPPQAEQQGGSPSAPSSSATPTQAPLSFDDLPPSTPEAASNIKFDDLPTANGANEQKYGTPGQQIITGLEGAARGVAGPLATLAETKLLGVPEENILGREKTNPTISGIGEGTGLVGSAFLAPEIKGLTLLGGVSGLAGKALATAAEHAPQAAEFLSKYPALAKIGSHAATAAIENTLIAGSDELTKMILHDPDQSAATSMLYAGGIGAVLGGGFGAVSPLFKATEDSKLGKFINDFKSRVGYQASDMSTPDAVGSALQKSVDSVDDMARRIYEEGGLKEQEIRKFLPQGEEAEKTAFGSAAAYHRQGQKLLETLEKNGAPPGIRNEIESALNKFDSNIREASSTGGNEAFAGAGNYGANDLGSIQSGDMFKIHDAINGFKQDLDRAAKWGAGGAPSDALADARYKLKGFVGAVRSGLEDPATWGKAGTVQRDINKAYSALLGKDGPMEQVRKAFFENLGGEHVVSPGRINTYMNQLGKPTAEIKQAKMENWIKAHDDFHDVIDDIYKRNGIENPYERASTETLAATTPTSLPLGAQVADAVMKQGVGHLAGGIIGAKVGGAFGHEGIGGFLGERLLGDKLSKVFSGLTRKFINTGASGSGAQSAMEYANNVVQGDNLVKKAAKSVFKAGSAVVPRAFVPDAKDREKLDKKVTEFSSNPSSRPDYAKADLTHYMPEHAEAAATMGTNAVNYLQSLKPKTAPTGVLDSKITPNAAEQARYDQALNIAHSPITVMGNVKNGSITPQQIMDLKSMYPALYTKFQSELMTEMSGAAARGETIPYQTKLGMSMFMGQALDSTMLPASIIAAQPVSSPPSQPQGSQTGTASKRSTKDLNKLPAMYKTAGQGREESRSSGSKS